MACRRVHAQTITDPSATAGGLVFIAANVDERIRAFDSDTGRVLWQATLPAGEPARPMTYALDGRQFVVITAGRYKDATPRGDYLIAYAVP